MKRRAVLLLAAMAAIVIVVGGTALAITYTPSKKVALKLNKPSFVATAATALYSNAIGPALKIGTDSTDPSATPLSLDTQTSEQAPMKVDSATKVDNLNADKVDGLDSTQLGVVSTEFNSARLGIGGDGFPLTPNTIDWSFFPRGDGNATVTVANGQLVVVNATASMGATGSADDLSLGICSQTGAGAVTLFDESTKLDDLSMDDYQHLPFTLSEVKTDLPAGEHTVGMCYWGGSGSWNIKSNRTLAQVYN